MATNPFGSTPLVAVGGDPAGASGPDLVIGAFWPSINMATARLSMRITGDVTEERLRDAVREAAITAIETLAAWKIAQLAAGAATLADTSLDTVDGEPINVWRFRRAIYCMAAASLAERYIGSDITGHGIKLGKIVEHPIDDLRRDAYWALADITGNQRTVVELI